MEQQKNEVLPGTYSITRAGKKQLAAEEESWRRAAEIMIRFLEPSEEKI